MPSHSMLAAFADIDPYAVLEVTKNLSPLEIKRSYKKLCLKFHPDKQQQSNGGGLNAAADPDLFPKLQFAYSILSDALKRDMFDQTGTVSGDMYGDGDFDWKSFFDSLYTEISVERIEEDKKMYQNSEEEHRDIIANFIYHEGDFLKLFEIIPHLEFTEEEEIRVFKIIEDSESIKYRTNMKLWDKYKRLRKTKVKSMLKKLAKEAREAKEWEKKNFTPRKSIHDKNGLAQLIKNRQKSRFETLINSLEQKYGVPQGEKRGPAEIVDTEFERTQNKMLKRKGQNK